MKGKVEKESGGNWGGFGGSTGMHGWSGTGTQEPGQSAQEGRGSKRGIEPKAGGSNAGFYASGTTNTDYAGTQKSGTSGHTKEGGNEKFACGGKTHMHANTGSRRAIGGQTSQ